MKTLVAMGDTHGRHEGLEVPDGDVLIHAGDFCRYGSRKDVDAFAEWFDQFPHKRKVIIAGNHDMALQKYLGYGHVFSLRGMTYLEDTSMEIYGLTFHGSPWTLPFQDWAFMLKEEKLLEKYRAIPDDTDVLITHGGPKGILDLTDKEGVHAGSLALMGTVVQLSANRPLVHLFGHIHERWGQFEDGHYRAFNVSICDFKYNPVNPCTVIEV